MVSKCLTILIITSCLAKLVTGSLAVNIPSENEEEDEEEEEEEETTTLSYNSFPQSRLEVDEDKDDWMNPSDSTGSKVENEDHEGNHQEKKGHGHKKKKQKKKLKKKNNPLQKFLPLLLIPFVIQTKIIPLFLFNLKIIAFKALMVGKLAMLLVAFNMFRNMLITNSAHVDHIDTKYSMDHVAHDHYGYNGGPEYGSWVNRRNDQSDPVYDPWERSTHPTLSEEK
ncbi:osiris 22 isoform X2 [Lycorma delicatula]|uniref:osiris 22 isoform X2 n=1 Tax=Lycorma delicatula TaxID=130591 RepID=UPI003F5173A9